MKWALFCFMSVTYAWGGWYSFEQAIADGIEAATSHPLAVCNGAIFRRGSVMSGSAVIVNERWVATAAHVLSPSVPEGFHPLQGNYSFSFQEEQKEVHSIINSFVFPSQDLAFLEIADLFPKDHVAPFMPIDEYQGLIEQWKYHPPVANQGQPAFFFGCGDKRCFTILEGRNKKYVEDVHHRTMESDLKTVTKEFGKKAVGGCSLSQYFPPDTTLYSSCFFSWVNADEQKDSLNSSALWGDSGGGMFVEQKGKTYLAGVVSKGHASHWDRGRRWLGTSFSTFYSPLHEGGTESYLETVLRVKD